MSTYRIINLRTEHLVADELQLAPDAAEWREITPPLDDELDTAGCNNLLVRCSNCGIVVRQGQSGTLMCPDCGEEYFHVQELRVRYLWDLPGLAIRITGKDTRLFLHIDVPQELREKHEIFYTTDGSTPTRRSLLYRHPIMLRLPVYTIRAMVQFGDYQSQTVEHVLAKPPTEYAYDCPICGKHVSGFNNVLFCPQCHYHRVIYENGRYTELGIKLRCHICATTLTATTDSVACDRCGNSYSYSKAGKWKKKGATVRCAHCQSLCHVPANDVPCPTCGYTFHFTLSGNKWSMLKRAPRTERSPYGLPSIPHRSKYPTPSSGSSIGKDVWDIVRFIIFLFVIFLLSHC